MDLVFKHEKEKGCILHCSTESQIGSFSSLTILLQFVHTKYPSASGVGNHFYQGYEDLLLATTLNISRLNVSNSYS